MLKSPQKKGKSFEREIAKTLSEAFGAEVRRTPCSGAIHSFMPMDIICMSRDSILSELHIECKKTQSLNHHKVYWRTKSLARKLIPCVIHAKNNDPEPIVTLGFRDFINLLQRIEEKSGSAK